MPVHRIEIREHCIASRALMSVIVAVDPASLITVWRGMRACCRSFDQATAVFQSLGSLT